MTEPVRLADVVEALEVSSDTRPAFLNRRSGEIVILTHDSIDLADGGGSETGLLDWQEEELREARTVLESPDFLGLPTTFDIHEYSIMQDFCRSVGDEELAEELLGAIRGGGAFRRFKDVLNRRGAAESWYEYRRAEYERIAAAWLDANGVEYVRGSAFE